MKVADFIAARLAFLGVTDAFVVTGGAAMHLDDAFGAEPGIAAHFMHHEQACSMAAEGYARIEWRPAAVVVTAGPGAINALNGVFGAFTDSLPMVVVTGQVRSDTLAMANGPAGLRQLGDQELRTTEMARPITKWAHLVESAARITEVVDKAFGLATTGRPGPVWLDVPVDIQSAQTDDDPHGPFTFVPASLPTVSEQVLLGLVEQMSAAQRPLILTGTGVRAAGVAHLVSTLAKALNAPVVTAWTHDVIDGDDPLFGGRPGTIGTRAGNFAVQTADVILVLGSRLNIRQVSYNWDAFALNARVIHVDIDEAELSKPYLKNEQTVVADLGDLMPRLIAAASTSSRPDHSEWVAWVGGNRSTYEPRADDYVPRSEGINPYHFVMELSLLARAEHVVVSGDATACIVPFQVMAMRDGMRLFSNSGCASMGYDLPAALGASVAVPDRPIICLAGDGSVMMNLQELQTLVAWGSDIVLFILDNDGYLSIKQTQANFFGREFGSSPKSGVTFPDFSAVAQAFGIPAVTLEVEAPWHEQLAEVLNGRGPRVCVVKLDRSQEFEPRLKSRMTPSGIVTPALDDMYPHLEDEVLAQVRASALAIGSMS